MSSNAIIGWVVAAIVFLGGGYLLLTHNSDDAMTGSDKMMASTSDQMMASSSDVMASSSDSMHDNAGIMASTTVDAEMMTR